MFACTLESSGCNDTARSRASASGCSPNETILVAPAACAARLSPGRVREIAQRREHIGDDQERRIRRHGVASFLADDGQGGTAFERSPDKLVTVAVLAQDRKERLSRLDAA